MKSLVERLLTIEDEKQKHKYALYFWRVLDNPAILQADISWLEAQDALRRQARMMGTNVIKVVVLLMGAAMSALGAFLSAKLLG